MLSVAEIVRTMRQKGKLRSWDDEKGFGFIVPNEGGKDVFLHISAFSNRNRRPETGEIVTFALSRDDRGRPRASKATLPGDRLAPSRGRNNQSESGKRGAAIIGGGFLLLVAISVISGKIPAIILFGYLAASSITFLVYAWDKTAAKNGTWRTSEATLHWLSLAGGWPGAVVAQQSLRHKSSKESFRVVFWLTVMINCAAFCWFFTSTGATAASEWENHLYDMFGIDGGATIEWAQ